MVNLSEFEGSLLELINDKTPSNFHCFPKNYPHNFNITGNLVLVTINYIGDSIEGSVITQSILHPTYSINIYSSNFMLTRKAHDEILNLFHDLDAHDFKMGNQRVQSFLRLRRINAQYDRDTNLSVSSIDYKFLISSI